MGIVRKWGLFCCLLMSGPARAADAAHTIRLAAEDWPPFIAQALPGDGVSGSFISAVLARSGYVLKVDYFPWKRTMQFGLTNPHYAGFLAVWRTPEREKLCHFSAPIGNTHTVLAYLKEAPLHAQNLTELKGVKIGTVAGYANGEQFDAMVKSGELTTEEGVNDETNLKKLFIKRFKVMIIEKHVLRHLLLGPDFNQGERESIAIADTFFKERPVHICFKRNPEGEVQQKMFNLGAREIDLLKMEKDYWRHLGQDSAAAPAGGAQR
ncbi:polar amino acid transport system substrate-binding protein [Oxalobacteraceae bacterium GrIS 1.11]